MKKLTLALILTIILGLSLYQINKPQVISKKYYAMGTDFTISIADKNFNDEVFDLAYAEFKRVETLFKANLDFTNKEVINLKQQALDLQNKTNNDFSIYLSDVISLWQFDKTNKTITHAPTKLEIEQALKSKKVNLYALAKGYGVDKAAEVLIKNGINNFIINAGGDVLVVGKNSDNKPWNIAINQSNNILSCNLDKYSVATSSNLYNAYTFNGITYGHLLNGNTGWPVKKEQSISILANNATTADAYATAVFVSDSLESSVSNNKEKVSLIKQTKQEFKIFNLPDNCKLEKFGL